MGPLTLLDPDREMMKALEKEEVNHPAHYGGADNPLEVIKIIDHYKLSFCLGNTIKYILRAGKKGDSKDRVTDLKKALWYLQHEIEKLEAEAE